MRSPLPTVTIDTDDLKKQKVTFRIVEGPRVTISKINFQGNSYFWSLRLKFAIHSSTKFWPASWDIRRSA